MTQRVGVKWVQTFAEVYLPAPVIGELFFCALNPKRAEENLQRVEQLVARCKVLEVKATTARIYTRIRLQLKQKGKLIL